MSEFIFTDQNFDAEVLKSPVPVLVDFWATWCGPCQMQVPIIEELTKEFDPNKVKIGKLSVEENQEIPAKYGIMSIPALFIFKNGEVVDQMVGLQTKSELVDKLNKLIS